MERVKDSYETSQQPLVSVIIPNYNHARYLDQRITTVLSQTYKNFEVIILDDCSTDNSLEVIDKYKDNPHISQIVVNDVNSGSTFCQWERGLGLARGELCWIAESDDYCSLDMLQELVEAFVCRENCVMAYTTSIVVDENNRAVRCQKIRPNAFFDGGCFVRRYMSLCNRVNNASAVVFSRQAASYVSKEYVKYKGAGDYLFWTQIAIQGAVAMVSKNLNYNRICSNAVTPYNFARGNMAKEDLSVLDFIDRNYGLSTFRKALSRQVHFEMFKSIDFMSSEAEFRSYEIWNLSDFHPSMFLTGYMILQDIVLHRLKVLI